MGFSNYLCGLENYPIELGMRFRSCWAILMKETKKYLLNNIFEKPLDYLAFIIACVGLVISILSFYNSFYFESPQRRPLVTLLSANVADLMVSANKTAITGKMTVVLKNDGKAPLVLDSMTFDTRPNTDFGPADTLPSTINPISPGDTFNYQMEFNCPSSRLEESVVIAINLKYRNFYFMEKWLHNTQYSQTLYVSYKIGQTAGAHATKGQVAKLFLDQAIYPLPR